MIITVVRKWSSSLKKFLIHVPVHSASDRFNNQGASWILTLVLICSLCRTFNLSKYPPSTLALSIGSTTRPRYLLEVVSKVLSSSDDTSPSSWRSDSFALRKKQTAVGFV